MLREFCFDEPIADVIRRRRSVRTYAGGSLPAGTREKLALYARELRAPFGSRVRFVLLDRPGLLAETGIKLGTYGFILGASTFVAAAVQKSERCLEDLGYVFEHFVLYLTSLGLGTCWIAGTFTRSEFAKALAVGPDEIMPCVSPVGYPAGIRGPIDLILKPIPGRKPRKPWRDLFFRDDFAAPLGRDAAGAYAEPLELVRLAPSAANRQPWRILERGGCFHFHLAHDAIYRHRYAFDLRRVDLGIAMFHFEAAAAEAGLHGRWENRQPAAGNAAPGKVEYIVTWVPD